MVDRRDVGEVRDAVAMVEGRVLGNLTPQPGHEHGKLHKLHVVLLSNPPQWIDQSMIEEWSTRVEHSTYSGE